MGSYKGLLARFRLLNGRGAVGAGLDQAKVQIAEELIDSYRAFKRKWTTRICSRAVRQRIRDEIYSTLIVIPSYQDADGAFEILLDMSNDLSADRSKVLCSWISKFVWQYSTGAIENALLQFRECDCLEPAAILLQEGVMRNKLSAHSDITVAIHAWIREKKHPLSWLPLSLSRMESRVRLKSYFLDVVGWGLPPHPEAFESDSCESSESLWNIRLEEIKDVGPEFSELSARAIESWQVGSNGQFEALFYRVAAESQGNLARADFCSTIASQIIVRDVSPEKILPTSPVDAFSRLFSAAANGGAYTFGFDAAYGRLMAWQSIIGLTGLPADVDFEIAALTAMKCRWFEFELEWFCQVAWDIGLLCVNPEQCWAGLLAATDTD